MEDDGFSDAVDSSDDEIRERNRENVRSRFSKVGFVDGIEKGKENTLQKGFDAGFRAGLRSACRKESIRGAIGWAMFVLKAM